MNSAVLLPANVNPSLAVLKPGPLFSASEVKSNAVDLDPQPNTEPLVESGWDPDRDALGVFPD